jgi:hypothetical protein
MCAACGTSQTDEISDNSLEALIPLSANVTALLLVQVLCLPAYDKFPLNSSISSFSIFNLCDLKFPLVFIIPPIQLFDPDRKIALRFGVCGP